MFVSIFLCVLNDGESYPPPPQHKNKKNGGVRNRIWHSRKKESVGQRLNGKFIEKARVLAQLSYAQNVEKALVA